MLAEADRALAEAVRGATGDRLGPGAVDAIVSRVIEGLHRYQAGRQRTLSARLQGTLRRHYPGVAREASLPPLDEAELLRAVRREVLLERRFQEAARARWETGLRDALRLPDRVLRAAAVETLKQVEMQYTRQREEAAHARVIGWLDARRMKIASPDGALWQLGTTVRSHTPDCVAMAGRVWPWSVLDRLHPPVHPQCACRLTGISDALAAGLITSDDIVSERLALRRARDIARRYPEVSGRLSRKRRREVADEFAGLIEAASYRERLHPRNRVGRWRKKAERDLVRFMDSPMGKGNLPDELPLAKADEFRDVTRDTFRQALADGELPDIAPGDTADSVTGLLDVGFEIGATESLPDGRRIQARHPGGAEVTVELDDDGVVRRYTGTPAQAPGRHGLDRPADLWDEHADDMLALAADLGDRWDAVNGARSFQTNPGLGDTAGLRTWMGDVTIGPDAENAIETAAELRAGGRRLSDDLLASLYLAHQVSAHEIAHAVNPTQREDYIAPEEVALEEALTDEVSHIEAYRRLAAQGQDDVVRWAATHPAHPYATGRYQREREGLRRIFSRAGVAPELRESYVYGMKFDMPPSERIGFLAALVQAGPRPLRAVPTQAGTDNPAERFVRAKLTQTPEGSSPAHSFSTQPPIPDGLPGEPWVRMADGREGALIDADGNWVWFASGGGDLVRARRNKATISAVSKVQIDGRWLKAGDEVRYRSGDRIATARIVRAFPAGPSVAAIAGDDSALPGQSIVLHSEDLALPIPHSPSVAEAAFEERLHPRNRLGKWIKSLGLPHYEVGGAVRDRLMGHEPKDIDYIAMASPQEIANAVVAAGGVADELTVRDRVVGVRAHAKGVTPEEGVEIVPPRIEESTGATRHDFVVVPHPAVMGNPGGDPIGDDARRRDFTFNALYRDPETGEIIDPTGRGVADAQTRTLHVIGADSFAEDPLRILRGLRFESQLGARPDEETLAQMRRHASTVSAMTNTGVSGTARTELNKLLMGEHVGDALRRMRDTGVMAVFIPELEPVIGFDQQSKYHAHKLDDHIIGVVERLAEMDAPLDVRLAALFHDAGKPASAWMGKDDRLHYYGTDEHEDHAIVGARVAGQALDRLGYDRRTIDRVQRIITHHMVAPAATKRPAKARKWQAEVGPDIIDDVLLHRRADVSTKGVGGAEEALAQLDRFQALVDAERDAPTSRKDLAITGQDLIDEGILEPGPEMGRVLAVLFARVLGDPELNTRANLLKLARRELSEATFEERLHPRNRVGKWVHKTTRVAPEPWETTRTKYGGTVNPADFPNEGWVDKPGGEFRDDYSEALLAKRDREKAWEASAKRAMTLGQISPDEARKRGLFAAESETYEPLPPKLYHVTTAKRAVLADGRLKTRDELDMGRATGLGGGSSDTISFTTSAETAKVIRDAMLEARRVVRGELSLSDLLDQARRGDRAERPWLDDITRQWGGDWPEGDPLPTELRARVDGRRLVRDTPLGGWRTSADAGPEGLPVLPADYEIVRTHEFALGDVRVMQATRPATEHERREDALDFYKQWSFWRQQAKGPMDPLFWNTDPDALAAMDPTDVGVLAAEPKPGAVGYSTLAGGLGEWRVHTGDAVTMLPDDNALDLEPRVRAAYVAQPVDVSTDPLGAREVTIPPRVTIDGEEWARVEAPYLSLFTGDRYFDEVRAAAGGDAEEAARRLEAAAAAVRDMTVTVDPFNDFGRLYRVEDEDGRRSLVVEASVREQEAVRAVVSEHLGIDVPMPPWHITVYTAPGQRGIGLVRPEDWSRAVPTGRTLDDLRDLSESVLTQWRNRRGEWIDMPDRPEPHLSVEEFAGIFDGFEHNGVRATVHSKRRWPPAGGRIGFELHDAEGQAGDGHYSFQGDTAKIETILLKPRVRDRGFASALHFDLFNRLTEAGFKRVELEAVDVGSYAWARQGFHWKWPAASEQQRMWGAAQARADVLARVPPEIVAEFDRKVRNGEFDSEAEMAAFGREHTWQQDGQTWWLGKAVLFDSYWEGVRDLG